MIWTEQNTQCTSGTFTIFYFVYIRNKRISTVYEPLTVEHHTITYGRMEKNTRRHIQMKFSRMGVTQSNQLQRGSALTF